MHRKRLLSTVAVLALCLCALVAVTLDSEDSEAASGTPGSTVMLTWHDLDEEFEISRFCIMDTIFGWKVEPPVTKSGSSARITIPAEAANGNYTFIESCVNPENGEELDHYTQTVTVSGQKGTSSSNPYSGPVSTPSSVGGYQNLSRTVYVSSGSSVNIDILQWNRENKDSLTITNGAGLSISTVNSYTKKVSGTLTSDCTITAKTWDTSSYKTITIALKSVGGSATEYTCYLYYNANGGSGAPANYSATDGSPTKTIQLSSVTPTKPGYQFLGWSKSSTATSASYNAGSSYSFDYGSIQLYAVWKQLSITVSGTPDSHAVVGNYWSFSPTVSVSGCSVSISGAPWLSATGTTVSGTPTQTGEYNVTLTFSKSGYTSATKSFTVTVISSLEFTSSPSGGAIIYAI